MLSQPVAIDSSAIDRSGDRSSCSGATRPFGVRGILARTSADWIEFRVAVAETLPVPVCLPTLSLPPNPPGHTRTPGTDGC